MKFGWKAVLGILISAAALIYAFHDVDWGEAFQQMANANYALLALSAFLATLMFPLRARRWRTILDPIAPKLPMGPLWRATAIGMMVNNVLPARAGEPARAFALTREVPQITFSASLASLVVDRVFDAIVVLLLTAVAIVAPGSPAESASLVGKAAIIMGVGAGGLLGGLYGLVFFPETLIRIFESLARRVSPAVEARGAQILRSFAEGLSILRSPAHFIAVFWWTLLHWLLQPLAFWIAFKAVGISVPWSAALLVQGVIVFGVAVPSTPGYFGLFEAAGTASLGLYGVGATAATTWAIVFHIASFIPITVIGAYYFSRLGISFGDVGRAGRDAAA
jgi:glycosyltransferase 2 family protein